MPQNAESKERGPDPSRAARTSTTFCTSLLGILSLIWEFTESNFGTFVVPNTGFGLFGALSGTDILHGQPPSLMEVAQRAPVVCLFNWYSVLIFDLANQRSPESIREDILNKPWRPIPSGRVTPDQTRRAMLVAIPTTLTLNYTLGVWKEGVFIHILTWLYNNLRGGDEIVRDLIISIAYGFFNLGSLRLAMGTGNTVSDQGYTWIFIVSGIILTTMQVQDLKDQVGDRARGRKTIPLVLGEAASRWMIAGFMAVWSGACSVFWRLPPWAYALPTSLGIYVGFRAARKWQPRDDALTWRLWCLWTALLYSLPLLHRLQGGTERLAFWTI